jgi:hypothetical protein
VRRLRSPVGLVAAGGIAVLLLVAFDVFAWPLLWVLVGIVAALLIALLLG